MIECVGCVRPDHDQYIIALNAHLVQNFAKSRIGFEVREVYVFFNALVPPDLLIRCAEPPESFGRKTVREDQSFCGSECEMVSRMVLVIHHVDALKTKHTGDDQWLL